MASKPSRNGHLPVNGLSLYYEVHGELGKWKTSPLLLIPGTFMATGSMKSWVSAFAAARGDRLRSARARPHSGYFPRDVVRAVRRRCRGVAARVERRARI